MCSIPIAFTQTKNISGPFLLARLLAGCQILADAASRINAYVILPNSAAFSFMLGALTFINFLCDDRIAVQNRTRRGKLDSYMLFTKW